MIDSSDGLLNFPFPATQPGFTMWAFHETAFDFPPLAETEPETFFSYNEPVDGSALENKTMNLSGLIKPVMDEERRLRRMKSNRESARRSRAKKQKYLENMRDELNRLITGRRELANRLEFVLQQNRVKRRENDGLRSESEKLRKKLWAMRQILILQHMSNINRN